MEDNIKRWTFKGKNALVLDIIRGSLTCAGFAGSIQTEVNGKSINIAVTVGGDGFIVGENPAGSEK